MSVHRRPPLGELATVALIVLLLGAIDLDTLSRWVQLAPVGVGAVLTVLVVPDSFGLRERGSDA